MGHRTGDQNGMVIHLDKYIHAVQLIGTSSFWVGGLGGDRGWAAKTAAPLSVRKTCHEQCIKMNDGSHESLPHEGGCLHTPDSWKLE